MEDSVVSAFSVKRQAAVCVSLISRRKDRGKNETGRFNVRKNRKTGRFLDVARRQR